MLSVGHPEWENSTTNQITVKDVSGNGGNRTYRIIRSKDENILAEVAFHLVGEKNRFGNQPDFLSVQKAATVVFASVELGPRRLHEKEDVFFINKWFGNSKCLPSLDVDIDLAKQLGVLLARIHSIDQKWYTPHYEKLLTKYAALVDVTRGSSFWLLTTRNWPLILKESHAGSMDSWMKRISEAHTHFIETEIMPFSSAGKRIVTTHGDFHRGNILVSNIVGKRVLNVIDFEQCHVSFAIQDISYCFWSQTVSNKKNKLAFAYAHLKEM